MLTEKTIKYLSKKAGAEHKQGMGHADSLLQSPLTSIPRFTPYTAFIRRSVAMTRRFLHDTTLSCLPLDSGSDAVAAMTAISTQGLSRLPARPVDVTRLQLNKQRDSMAHCDHTKSNNETRELPDRKQCQVMDCEARCRGWFLRM